MCGIELAWSDSKISFRKPLSCHLFPPRIKYYSDFRAVNYQEISICASALKTGQTEGIYVYEFLRNLLSGPWVRSFMVNYVLLRKSSGREIKYISWSVAIRLTHSVISSLIRYNLIRYKSRVSYLLNLCKYY